jgi:hypothetical protein
LEAAARSLVKATTPADVKQTRADLELALGRLDAARADVARAVRWGTALKCCHFATKVIRADVAVVAINTLGPQLTNG